MNAMLTCCSCCSLFFVLAQTRKRHRAGDEIAGDGRCRGGHFRAYYYLSISFMNLRYLDNLSPGPCFCLSRVSAKKGLLPPTQSSPLQQKTTPEIRAPCTMHHAPPVPRRPERERGLPLGGTSMPASAAAYPSWPRPSATTPSLWRRVARGW